MHELIKCFKYGNANTLKKILLELPAASPAESLINIPLDNDLNRALHLVMQHENQHSADAMALLLIEYGADIKLQNAQGRDALHEAAWYYQKLVFRRLIILNNQYKGSNTINFSQKTEFNRTLVHTLAANGLTDLIELLPNDAVEKLINLKTTNDDNMSTALHRATTKGHVDMIQWLLDHDADPSLRNKIHETPLMIAILYKHDEAVKCFYEYGIQLSDADRTILLEDKKYQKNHEGIKAALQAIDSAMSSSPTEQLRQKIQNQLEQLDNEDIDSTSRLESQLVAALDSKFDKLRVDMQAQFDEYARRHREAFNQYMDTRNVQISELRESIFREIKEDLKSEFSPLMSLYYGNEDQDALLRGQSQLWAFTQEVERHLGSRLLSAFSLVSGLIAREQTKLDKLGKSGSAVVRGICQSVPFIGGLVGELASLPVSQGLRSFKNIRQKRKYEAVIDSFANGHELLLFAGIVARRLTIRDQTILMHYDASDARERGRATARELYGVIKTGGLLDLAGSTLDERVDCLLKKFPPVRPSRRTSPENRARVSVTITLEDAVNGVVTEETPSASPNTTTPRSLFYTRLGSQDAIEVGAQLEIPTDLVSSLLTP